MPRQVALLFLSRAKGYVPIPKSLPFLPATAIIASFFIVPLWEG
jgi:hypothetical protein